MLLLKSRKVGKAVIGVSGQEAILPVRRIGKPARLADSPWGKPSVSISSPGPTCASSDISGPASHASGMARVE